jgi:hypothetical protein
MKNLGAFILLYNLVSILIMDTNFWLNNWQIIDSIDTPFYIASAIIVLFLYRKLNIFQKQCYLFSFIFLVFKLIDLNYPIDYINYKFWSILIIATPIILLIERNINYDKFSK